MSESFSDTPDDASAAGTSPEAATPAAPTSKWRSWAGEAGALTWIVWIVFGLVFAFVVWQGISALFFPGTALQAVRQTSFWVFVAVALGGIVVPLALAWLAVWFGRAQHVGVRALLLLTALAASPAIVTTFVWLGTLVVIS